MTPYFEREGARLYHGEALAMLREMPDASVDAVVTDPPYSSGGAFRGDRVTKTSDKYVGNDVARVYAEFSGDTRDQRAFAYWEALGKLTGREREARTMIETFSRKLATITADVRQIPKEKRKRVYFEAAHRPLHTFAPASLAMFVLESAGGVNVDLQSLIRNIYAVRASDEWTSGSPSLRPGLRARFEAECLDALNMLDKGEA